MQRSIVTVLLIFISIFSFASTQKTWKVAVLENFVSASITPGHNYYQQDYSRGLLIAKQLAKQYGVNLQVKKFLYGNDPIAILQKIKKVQSWKANLIVGPRFSNQFILLRHYFKHTLVLSPMASSILVSSLPDNMHSLELPSTDAAVVINHVLQQYYAKRSVLALVQVDCKACQDVADALQKHFKQAHKMFISRNVLKNNTSLVDVNNLLKGFHAQRAVIFLPNDAVTSFVLMVRVMGKLKVPVVFVGASSWGAVVAKKIKNIHDIAAYFTGIHISPSAADKNSKLYQNFLNEYKLKYQCLPRFSVSFAVTKTIMSAVIAYKKYKEKSPSLNSAIIVSYNAALKQNKWWYKSTYYNVYKTHKTKTQLLEVVSLKNLMGE